MATSITTPTPTTASGPLSLQITGGTIQEVQTILQDALNVLSVIPATAPVGAMGSIILGIIAAAVKRIQEQTGKPIDLNLIPEEPLVP